MRCGVYYVGLFTVCPSLRVLWTGARMFCVPLPLPLPPLLFPGRPRKVTAKLGPLHLKGELAGGWPPIAFTGRVLFMLPEGVREEMAETALSLGFLCESVSSRMALS